MKKRSYLERRQRERRRQRRRLDSALIPADRRGKEDRREVYRRSGVRREADTFRAKKKNYIRRKKS